MARVTYTEKQKAAKIAKAKEAHAAGKSWDEAAKAAGIARLTLFNWMKPGRKPGRKPVVETDGVVEAVLKTPAAQKAMFEKIRDWAQGELMKL